MEKTDNTSNRAQLESQTSTGHRDGNTTNVTVGEAQHVSTRGALNSKRKDHRYSRVQFLAQQDDLQQDMVPQHQILAALQSENELGPQKDWDEKTKGAAQTAQDRAKRLESRLGVSNPSPQTRRSSNTPDYFSQYAPSSGLTSPISTSPPLRPLRDHPVRLDDIPLNRIPERRPYDINDETTDDDSDTEDAAVSNSSARDTEHDLEARRLMRTFTNGIGLNAKQSKVSNHGPIHGYSFQRSNSGSATPALDKRSHDVEYVPPPQEYKPSVLSSILFAKLADYEHSKQNKNTKSRIRKPSKVMALHSGRQSPDTSSGRSSGRFTPKGKKPKWYDKSPCHSFSSTTTLLADCSGSQTPSNDQLKPFVSRTQSTGMIATAVDMITHPSSRKSSPSNDFNDHVVQLEVQLSDILARRKYLLKLCKSLMIFGAPTHRLEEYMNTSTRKLMVQGSFQYLPNCMIVSFDDPDTHTTEVHLVKEMASIDLSKFKDVFDVYKNVIHEKYTALEALEELNEIMDREKSYPKWLLVIVYGIAAISVGPFAFQARPIDFPICFLLGCLLGWLQLFVAPNSAQFSHVFEVLASVFISFAARGFGSIMYRGNSLFCFSAITQSSIALILPGWIILCAAQELQSRNLIAGSIRMVYAIIYTLFLGFGILIGTTLMGLVYPSATDAVTCHTPWWWDGTTPRWRAVYVNFVWVPVFTICLAMVNQARWRQMLPMTIISIAGYTTNYFATLRFAQNIQVANACGAFVIGAMANLYSRFFHGLAAATMLPAIFVQVPSGLAASGSLVAGLTGANQITGNSSQISVVNNGTQGFLDAQSASFSGGESNNSLYGGTIFNVGYGMVQVAIGISVGLFLSALFVYPFNKRRSGLFSF